MAIRNDEDDTMDNQQPSEVSDDSEGSETTETFSDEREVSLDGKKFRLGAHEKWIRINRRVNEDILRQMYLDELMSITDISKQTGMGNNSIAAHMRWFGIPIRSCHDNAASKSVKYVIDENYFETIDTPNKAYSAGFLSTDGFLEDIGRRKRIKIAIAESDGYILENIISEFASPDLVKRNIPRKVVGWSPIASLILNRTKLVDDLSGHGFPVGRHSGLEPFIRLATDDLTWSYIRGVFDADGCIRTYFRKSDRGIPLLKTKFSLTTGKSFIIGFLEYLNSFGITVPDNCHHIKGGTYELELASPMTVLAIAKHMYSPGGWHLTRKKFNFDLLQDIVRTMSKDIEVSRNV